MIPLKIVEASPDVGQAGDRLASEPPPARNGRAIRIARPPTFKAVPITWRPPPWRVPRTLTVVTTAIARTAAPACQILLGIGRGAATTCAKYCANAAASVAIDPLRTTRNSTQPNRNAGRRP